MAGRVAAGFSEGEFVFQRQLRTGGVDLGGIARIDTTRFPVRGFNSGELRGDNAAIGSLEYRFPLLQIDRGPVSFPLYFHRLLGATFIDTGTAWNRQPVDLPNLQLDRSRPFESGRRLTSAGAEISLDLFVGYFVPLRYRAGAAYLIEAPRPEREGRTTFYVSLGSSF